MFSKKSTESCNTEFSDTLQSSSAWDYELVNSLYVSVFSTMGHTVWLLEKKKKERKKKIPILHEVAPNKKEWFSTVGDQVPSQTN